MRAGPPTPPGWAAVVVNYEAGPLLAECVARCSPTTSAGAARGRRGRQRLARRVASTRSTPRAPGRHGDRPGREPRLRPRRQPRDRRHHRAGGRGVQPRPEVEPGTAAALVARLDAEARPRRGRPAAPQPRRLAVPVGPVGCRRRRRGRPRGARAVVGPSNRFTRRLPPARRRPGPAARRRLGLGRGAVAAARRRSTGSAGGTSGTSCSSRTSTCAGGSDGAGWRIAYEPGRRGRCTCRAPARARHPYRMIVEHHRSAYRFAAKSVARTAPPAAARRGRASWRAAGGRRHGGATRCGRGPRTPRVTG